MKLSCIWPVAFEPTGIKSVFFTMAEKAIFWKHQCLFRGVWWGRRNDMLDVFCLRAGFSYNMLMRARCGGELQLWMSGLGCGPLLTLEGRITIFIQLAINERSNGGKLYFWWNSRLLAKYIIHPLSRPEGSVQALFINWFFTLLIVLALITQS